MVSIGSILSQFSLFVMAYPGIPGIKAVQLFRMYFAIIQPNNHYTVLYGFYPPLAGWRTGYLSQFLDRYF